MMKDLIIFGRSLFINRLDITKIDYDKFDVCCINSIIPNVKAKYLVSADKEVNPLIPDNVEWCSVNNGWELVKTNDIIQEEGKLSWRHYSSDLAVNFAILRGYKTLYLAGIDLMENDTPFQHYDGIVNVKTECGWGMKDEQKLIKYFGDKFNVKIYNLNPNVKWIDFIDIGLLK